MDRRLAGPQASVHASHLQAGVLKLQMYLLHLALNKDPGNQIQITRLAQHASTLKL